MKRNKRHLGLRFSAVFLRRLLIVLSMPLLASACNTHKPGCGNNNNNSDSLVVLPSDTSNPNYYGPNTICEYGVPRVNPIYDSTIEQPMYGVPSPDELD